MFQNIMEQRFIDCLVISQQPGLFGPMGVYTLPSQGKVRNKTCGRDDNDKVRGGWDCSK